jgi:hypothetical protein
MTRMAFVVAVALAAVACGSKSEDKPAAGSAGPVGSAGSGGFGSGSGSGSAGAAKPVEDGKLGANDMPKECDEWKTMVDKLMACEKMPEPQRKVMKDAYDQASAGWPKLPATSKAQLATSCKAGADAIMSSAKATCGW